MADLRIVDAPLLSTVKGTEKLPTGGEGNFSVSIDQVADFSKIKWTLATEGYVDNAVGGVRSELVSHVSNTSNPHQVTKSQVGLGNVDNTADVDKPIGSATQAALATLTQNKAEKTYVDTQLNSKADKSTTYSKTESDSLLANKSDTSYLNTKYSSHIKTFLNTGTALANTANGEYFFVISSNAEKVEDLYLNVNGVATNQNKSELSSLLQHNSILGRDVAGAHQATSIGTASGSNQQAVNDFGGAKWYSKSGGYDLGATLKLESGDIVKSTVPNNTNDPNVDMTGWDYVNSKKVNSVSDLIALSNPKDGQAVYVKGYYADSLEGGGYRVYVASRSAENDGFLCINGWVLQVINNTVTPEQAGAKGGNPAFDDGVAIQKAINSGFEVSCSEKTYYIDAPLYHRTGFKMLGQGFWSKTRIFKTTNNVGSLPSVLAPDGVTMVSYQKDATLIAIPDSGDYCHDVSIENILIGREWDEGSEVFGTGYGYFAPYLAQSSFKSVYCNATRYTWYTINQWMCEFTRCEGAYGEWVTGGLDGDVHRGGTTSTYNSCWSKVIYLPNAVAWRFKNMGTVTMNSCGSDGIGADASIASAVILAEDSTVILNSFGIEVTKATNIIKSIRSTIKISGLGFYQVYNSYGQIFAITDNSVVSLDTSTLVMMNTALSGTPDFALVDGGSSFFVENVKSNPPIWGVAEGAINANAILVGTNGHAVFDSSDSRQEVSRGSGGQTTYSKGINITNRAHQSTNITDDIGPVHEDAISYSTNSFRMGGARIFRDAKGYLRQTKFTDPVDQYDGVPIGGIPIYPNDTLAKAIEGNIYFNSTSNTLKIYTGSAWRTIATT